MLKLKYKFKIQIYKVIPRNVQINFQIEGEKNQKIVY